MSHRLATPGDERPSLPVDSPSPPDEPLTEPRPAQDPTDERPAWTVDTNDRPAPSDGAPTEMRVHGVSGSPAEDMLDRPLIRQVAGDSGAGFFRPRTEYGATHGPGGAWLEAYRWGNLTSGAAARAFWLLLLPFSLANVAMWLRPPATGMGRRVVHGLCRLFALTMSGTFVLMAVGISMDLFAWQCAAPDASCVPAHPWLRWAFTGVFEATGRRLALGALGPLLVISVLWWLAMRSWARYESYDLPERNPDGDGLATPSFWDGRAQVGRLRSLHVAAMLAVLDGVLLYVLLDHDWEGASFDGVDLGLPAATVIRIGEALGIAALAIIALALLLLMVPWMVDRVSKSRAASVLAKSLRWLALIVTVLTFAYAVLPRADWSTTTAMPGFAGIVTKLLAAQAAMLALLLLVVAFQRHRCKGAFLAGFGTPVIASLGLGLGAAFSAGISYRAADYLDGTAVRNATELADNELPSTLSPPVQYQWAAVGFVLLAVVVLLAFLAVRFIVRPGLVLEARRDTDNDFPGGRQRDPGRAAQLDRSVATARFTDHLSTVLGLAWLVVGLSGLVAIGFALFDKGPVKLVEANEALADVVSVVVNVGTYLISLSALGLILLGIQTYRNPRIRRTVGIVWDLATFWPRASHPLAPPCYAERVVPELVHRSTWLAKEQNGVVVSGHSQGTVLAAATILQLPPEARARTALITYGSPLMKLYGRAFPVYFSNTVMTDIAAAVSGRWVNLWRRTDPIGGPVGVGDRRLADPMSFDALPGDRIPPAPQAHGGYQLTPQFGQAMNDLVAQLPVHDRVLSAR